MISSEPLNDSMDQRCRVLQPNEALTPVAPEREKTTVTDNMQYHPSHIVMDALKRLSSRDWTEIFGSAKRSFWWFARVQAMDNILVEAMERLDNGRRKFSAHKVDLNDAASLKAAFLGVVKSIGNEYIEKLKHIDNNHVAFSEDTDETSVNPLPNPRNPLSFLTVPAADSSTDYTLSPEEILLLREEHDESNKLVKVFLSFLGDRKPILRQVCEMRLEGMKNRDIALHLNRTNKEIGNLVGDITRHAIKFFSLRLDRAKNKYHAV